jgi:aminoglycoside phosphotransferase (APT) family kinase protein
MENEVITQAFYSLKQTFGTAAQPEFKGQALDLESAIKAEIPRVKEAVFYTAQYGQLAHTFLLTKEVFKGPREAAQAEAFYEEPRIQQMMHAGGIKTPGVTAVGTTACFYGMQRMEGVALTGQWTEMTVPERMAVMREIGKLKFKAEEISRGQEMPKMNESDGFVSHMHMLEDPAVQEALRGIDEKLPELLRDYLSRYMQTKPVIIHNDCNSGNILVDPATKNFCGVLDWGLARATQMPEVEFIKMQMNYGPEYVEEAWKSYAEAKGIPAAKTDLMCCAVLEQAEYFLPCMEPDDPEMFDMSIACFVMDIKKALDGGRIPYGSSAPSQPENGSRPTVKPFMQTAL